MVSKLQEWGEVSRVCVVFSDDFRYNAMVVPLRTKEANTGQPWYSWYLLDDEDGLIVAQGQQPSEEEAKSAAEAAFADEVSPVPEKTDAG